MNQKCLAIITKDYLKLHFPGKIQEVVDLTMPLFVSSWRSRHYSLSPLELVLLQLALGIPTWNTYDKIVFDDVPEQC